MSYILDALKKSAEQRQKLQSAPPQYPADSTLSASVRQSRRHHVRKRLLRSVLALLTFLLVVSLGYRFFMKDSEKEAIPGTSQTVTAQAVQPKAGAGSSAPPAPEFSNNGLPRLTNEKSVKTEPPAPPATPPATPPAPSPGPEKTVVLLKDLPVQLQVSLPELKISGHVYSPAPPQRLAMVNGSIIREGELLNPDIRVEEITEDGIIFSYQQEQFKLGLSTQP